jgi:hypothetical protein
MRLGRRHGHLNGGHRIFQVLLHLRYFDAQLLGGGAVEAQIPEDFQEAEPNVLGMLHGRV